MVLPATAPPKPFATAASVQTCAVLPSGGAAGSRHVMYLLYGCCAGVADWLGWRLARYRMPIRQVPRARMTVPRRAAGGAVGAAVCSIQPHPLQLLRQLLILVCLVLWVIAKHRRAQVAHPHLQ